MLSHLKQENYSLGIITNGLATFQTSVMAGLGVQNFFETVLISESEQIRKPEPEIFRRAVRRLGIIPEQAVFVGDHPEVDIRGAKGAGLKAIWKRSPFWPEPYEADAIIDELNALPIVISALSDK